VQAVAHTIKEITMANNLNKGDQVEWDTSQGKTHGTVERKQPSEPRSMGTWLPPRRTTRNTL
jgi:hypothetical protein